jgi:hypothetical protein
MRRIGMNKNIGLFILVVLSIGGIFGIFMGAAMENIPLGITLGAIGALVTDLFIEAVILENEKSKRRK